MIKTLPKKLKDKYDISRNTFIRKDKGEKAEEREVEIGDESSGTTKQTSPSD